MDNLFKTALVSLLALGSVAACSTGQVADTAPPSSSGPHGSGPGEKLGPVDPRCLLHAATVSAADGPVRPPMVYGGATKG